MNLKQLQGIKERAAKINPDRYDANDTYHSQLDVPELIAEVERLLAENKKFTNSILHDTYNEFVHTAEIAKLQHENEKLKYIIEQMVSKKSYKDIINFAEGRLEDLSFDLEEVKQ